MPNTARLTDNLPEIIDAAWEDVRSLLADEFIDNGDSETPCLYNVLDYSGSFSEIIDSAVPIYTSELRELAYFHHDAAIAALIDTFGSADGDWPSGPFAAGLYTLIEQGVSERYDQEAADLWEQWHNDLQDLAAERCQDAATLAGQDEDPADYVSLTTRDDRLTVIDNWRKSAS